MIVEKCNFASQIDIMKHGIDIIERPLSGSTVAGIILLVRLAQTRTEMAADPQKSQSG